MTYCTRLTNNDPFGPNYFDLTKIKSYFKVAQTNVGFDDRIKQSILSAIAYVQSSYNIVLIRNEYECRYNEEFFDLPEYSGDGYIEIPLPKPANSIDFVGFYYPEKEQGIPPIGGGTERYKEIPYSFFSNKIRICDCSLYYGYINMCGCDSFGAYYIIIANLGFDKIPDDLFMAIIQLATYMYQNKCECSTACKDNLSTKSILDNYRYM